MDDVEAFHELARKTRRLRKLDDSGKLTPEEIAQVRAALAESLNATGQTWDGEQTDDQPSDTNAGQA